MTDQDIPSPSTQAPYTNPELQAWHDEALGLEEPMRSEQLAALAELAASSAVKVEPIGHTEAYPPELQALIADMDDAEAAQTAADYFIGQARTMAHTVSDAQDTKEQDKPRPKRSINFGRIGWIHEEEQKEIPVETIKAGGIEYDFVDLIPKSNATAKIFEKLKLQTEAGSDNLGEELLRQIKEATIPQLDNGIRKGRGLRPIHAGNRSMSQIDAEQSLNTSYPAYKLGVRGTQNRAIILRIGDDVEAERPLYVLVALYDHDDDRSIHNALFLKDK